MRVFLIPNPNTIVEPEDNFLYTEKYFVLISGDLPEQTVELQEIDGWRTNSALRKKIHESSRGYLYGREDHKNALNKFTVRSLSEERNKVLKKLQNRSPDPPDINRLFFAVNIKNGTIATNVFLDEFNASGNKDLNTFLQSIIDTETTRMTALSSFRLKYNDFRERILNVEANDDIEKTEMFKSMYEEL